MEIEAASVFAALLQWAVLTAVFLLANALAMGGVGSLVSWSERVVPSANDGGGRIAASYVGLFALFGAGAVWAGVPHPFLALAVAVAASYGVLGTVWLVGFRGTEDPSLFGLVMFGGLMAFSAVGALSGAALVLLARLAL